MPEKRRSGRHSSRFRRRPPVRRANERILIVCEGEKTEPDYFEALRESLSLHGADVVIPENDVGNNPMSVVECALREYREEKIDRYDGVFCVFDRDRHTDYTNALDRVAATKLKGGGTLHAISSVPCFEFWILLHFIHTTRPFESAEGSHCDSVIRELKKHLPRFRKEEEIFALVKDRMDDAINNAKKVEHFHETSGTDNPSTRVHILVLRMKAMAEKAREIR